MQNGEAILYTRNGLNWSKTFPHIHKSLEGLGLQDAIFDGEIVALDDEGHTDFQKLQNSLKSKQDKFLRYYIFDLLYLNGKDLRELPLRAFDDGRRVFIQMPEGMEATEAPPLFVVGESGPELVNYRVRGRFYVVDRIFDRAEMRLGDRRQRVVRIDRQRTATERDAHG